MLITVLRQTSREVVGWMPPHQVWHIPSQVEQWVVGESPPWQVWHAIQNCEIEFTRGYTKYVIGNQKVGMAVTYP